MGVAEDMIGGAIAKGQGSVTNERAVGLGNDFVSGKKSILSRLAKRYRTYTRTGHRGKAGKYYTEEDYQS